MTNCAEWAIYEKEFGLIGRSYIEAAHIKRRDNGDLQEHKHRVYMSVDDKTGNVINLDNSFRRNELVSRLCEIVNKMPLIKGKHNKWVEAELSKGKWGEANTEFALQKIAESGITKGFRAVARFKEWELRQENRTGINRSELADNVASFYAMSDCAETFRDYIGALGIGVFEGEKGVVLLDQGGGVHSLERTLKAGYKAHNQRFEHAFPWDLQLELLTNSKRGRKKKNEEKEEITAPRKRQIQQIIDMQPMYLERAKAHAERFDAKNTDIEYSNTQYDVADDIADYINQATAPTPTPTPTQAQAPKL
jgi:hypothetical protein